MAACAGGPSPVLSLEQAPSNSTAWQAYNAGVKMGCWGLVIYAATGAICSGEWSQGAASRRGLCSGEAGLPALGEEPGNAVSCAPAAAGLGAGPCGDPQRGLCPWAWEGPWHLSQDWERECGPGPRRGTRCDGGLLAVRGLQGHLPSGGPPPRDSCAQGSGRQAQSWEPCARQGFPARSSPTSWGRRWRHSSLAWTQGAKINAAQQLAPVWRSLCCPSVDRPQDGVHGASGGDI